MILSAYKYRFYPNTEQAEMLVHTFSCVHFVYKTILAFSQEQYVQSNKTRFSDWNKKTDSVEKRIQILSSLKRYQACHYSQH